MGSAQIYLHLAQNLAVIVLKLAEWCRRFATSYYDIALNLTNSISRTSGNDFHSWSKQYDLERVLRM